MRSNKPFSILSLATMLIASSLVMASDASATDGTTELNTLIAQGKVIVVPTYTLHGFVSIAHQSTSGVHHVAVNVTNIATEALCNAEKEFYETMTGNLESTTKNGTIQPATVDFVGRCTAVKEFVFARNLL